MEGTRTMFQNCGFSHDLLLASGNRGGSQRRTGRSFFSCIHSEAKQSDGEKDDKEDNSDKRSQILSVSI